MKKGYGIAKIVIVIITKTLVFVRRKNVDETYIYVLVKAVIPLDHRGQNKRFFFYWVT